MKAVIKTKLKIKFSRTKLNDDREWCAEINTEGFSITTFGKTKLEAAEDLVKTLNKDGYLGDSVELEVVG